MSTVEKWKYDKAYTLENYHLQGARADQVYQDVMSMHPPASYLDVGCGRGESLDWAETRGFAVRGTELVDEIIANDERIDFADVCALQFSDDEFEYVSCYDVLEHLVPGTEQAALDELGRVCSRRLIVTTNDKPSRLPTGEDLHINKRPREAWHADIVRRFGAENVVAERYGIRLDEWKWIITVSR